MDGWMDGWMGCSNIFHITNACYCQSLSFLGYRSQFHLHPLEGSSQLLGVRRGATIISQLMGGQICQNPISWDITDI